MHRFLLLVLLIATKLPAQEADTVAANRLHFLSPAPSFHKKRMTLVAGTQTLGYGGSLGVLATFWYTNYDRTKFHLFNDNAEWLQMDKAGHTMTAYTLAVLNHRMYRWAGADGRKSILPAIGVSFLYQGTIELLDGFSGDWGFSTGDLLANAGGIGIMAAQQYGWNEQRIALKISSHRSPFANLRPDVLGKSRLQQIIKDYNGQTYWMSVNIASFLKEENTFPKWLNVAAGYGAEGMTGGFNNVPVTNAAGNTVDYKRFRQFYLALDVDLTRIPDQGPLLRAFTNTFGFVKIPAPALSFSSQGVGAHLFYY